MYDTLFDDEFQQFIKQFENFSDESYLDSAGVFTIGWGTTKYPDGQKVKDGQKISAKMADFIFTQHCKDDYDKMIKLIPFNPNIKKPQLIALLSLVYNIGLTEFKKSTLLKFLKEDLLFLASHQFLRWIYVKGVIVQGLVNRRNTESEKFRQGLPSRYFPMQIR
jgi:lysozyme